MWRGTRSGHKSSPWHEHGLGYARTEGRGTHTLRRHCGTPQWALRRGNARWNSAPGCFSGVRRGSAAAKRPSAAVPNNQSHPCCPENGIVAPISLRRGAHARNARMHVLALPRTHNCAAAPVPRPNRHVLQNRAQTGPGCSAIKAKQP